MAELRFRSHLQHPWVRALLGVWAACAALPALAHHVMDGATPATALQGLLSGLAHPVIEIDHFVFLLGAGVALARGGQAVRGIALCVALFVAAGFAGTLLRITVPELPFAEAAVAVSLLALAAMLWWRRWPATAAVAATLTAAAGLVHGYAYGEAIVGAEATPLAGYLAGLAIVQAALLAACVIAARALGRRWGTGRVTVGTRPLAVLAAAVGLFGLAAPLWG